MYKIIVYSDRSIPGNYVKYKDFLSHPPCNLNYIRPSPTPGQTNPIKEKSCQAQTLTLQKAAMI